MIILVSILLTFQIHSTVAKILITFWMSLPRETQCNKLMQDGLLFTRQIPMLTGDTIDCLRMANIRHFVSNFFVKLQRLIVQ